MKQQSLLSAVVMIMFSITTFAAGAAQAASINLGQGHSPDIATDGQGHLFVVFEGENNSGAADIFYCSSNDGGRSWRDRLDVSPTMGVSTHPKVAVEKDGAVDVVWTDTSSGENSPDIFFARSIDAGRTWSKPMNISNTPAISREPEMDVGPDNTIHVVFSDDGKGDKRDIFYTSSNDGGKTWSKDRQLENVSNTPGDSTEPTIAVGSDGIVHVAWKDDSAGDQRPQIFYSQRAQNTWSTAENISKSDKYSYQPVVACGSNGLTYVSWSDRSLGQDAANIWCSSSINNGAFTHPVYITDSASIVSDEGVAVEKPDTVAIVWSHRANACTPPKIYLKTLSNHLNRYAKPTKYSQSKAMQMAPDIAIDRNQLIVVWEERRPEGKTLIKTKSIDLTR